MPALSPAQPTSTWVHEPRLWLAVPGIALFAISYGVAFIVGAVFALNPSGPANSVSDDIACNSTCRTQGALLMVPVAGPLLMTEPWPHRSTDTEAALVWSGIEAAGLAMLVVGLIGHDVLRVPRQTESRAPRNVSVAPLLTPQSGALSLRIAW